MTPDELDAFLPDALDAATRISKGRRAHAVFDADGVLRITAGPEPLHVGRSFPLRGEQTSIGRDTSNAIALNDPDVSRHHALLLLTSRGHEVHDLNSMNGTVLNGQKVAGYALLSGGDTLLIGATALVYERRRGADRADR